MRFFLLIIFLAFLCHTQVYGQELSFKAENLVNVLNAIENQSDITFNYDPELVSRFSFTGEVNIGDMDRMLSKLLEDTPLSFEINGSHVLISYTVEKEQHICGYIRDLEGKEIEGAEVYLENTSVGTVTDSNGYFTLHLKVSGDPKIILSHLGYEKLEKAIADFGEGNCLTLELQETNYELDGVVLNYILKGISEGSGYGASSINTNTLFKNNVLQEYDVLKIAQLLPGISSVDESASNLNIRGSTQDQNLVVLDGVTLYNPSHVLGLMSSINPFIVDGLDVYKSVYDPSYENRIGGIVDISLPDEIIKTFEGGIGTTLADSHAYFKTPVISDKLSLLASGRYVTNKYFDSPIIKSYAEKIFLTNIVGEEGPGGSVGFRNGDDQLNFSDFNVKLMYRSGKNVHATVSYYGSKDKTGFISNAAGDDLQSNESVFSKTEAFSTKMNFDWGRNFSSDFFFSTSKYRYENQSLFSNNPENNFSFSNSSSNDIRDLKLKVLNKFDFTKGMNLDIGYTLNVLDVDYFLDQNSNSDVDISGMNSARGSFHNLSASLQWEREKLMVRAGLGSTHYNEFGQWFFSPRFNLQYLLNEDFKFKFSSGIFQQFVNQLEIVGNTAINSRNNLWILSNEETGNQLNAIKTATGFVYQSKNWLFDVEAYYHKTKGISSLSTLLDDDSLIDGSGESDIIGLDILLKRNWKHYNLWLNYTLSKNTYSLPSSNFENFPANNDQRHNLGVFNTLKVSNWGFSWTYMYKSGLPFSLPTGIGQGTSEGNSLIYERINDQRLAHYDRLDLGVSYRTKLKKEKINFEVAVSILNVLDRRNIFSKDFFIADLESSDQLQINSIERFQLKRTPQILLRLYW